jgi:hypothetical protein
MMQYRNTILLGSAVVGGGGTPIQADFTLLSRAARRLAPRIAFGGSTVALRGSRFHVEGSPTRAIHALLRDRLPQFVKNLDAMRRGITSSSWIEIQGCRVGQDLSYLRAAQAFFGGGKRPRVSAPDWYQFFGSYRVEILEDSPAALKRLWGRQQVQDAFAYWHRVFTGSPPAANADERTLRNFLRAPHALPLTSPYPSLRGIDLVLLKGVEERAFLLWLGRHSARLTTERAIRSQLFGEESIATRTQYAPVDWLQEKIENRAMRRVFRPDPDYQKHIIEV